MPTLFDPSSASRNATADRLVPYPDILDLEKRSPFVSVPHHVGHELMVPNVGDYYVPEWMNGAKMLVHNDNGIELLSNVCRHRQSLLLRGRGTRKEYRMPHTSLDIRSQKVPCWALPHFPENPCLNLGSSSLQRVERAVI